MSSTNCIVKAARNLHHAIDGTTATATDELQVIEHLRALLLGTTEPPPLPEHPVQQLAPQQFDFSSPQSFEQQIEQPLQQPVKLTPHQMSNQTGKTPTYSLSTIMN